MKLAILFSLFLAALPAQTVQIRKPDGTPWSGALAPHPRVMMDAEMRQRLADPDGSGAAASPRATSANPAWLALHEMAADRKRDMQNLVESGIYEGLIFTALGFYMDNAASFSGTNHRNCSAAMQANEALDPTKDCYKWFALDLIKNWPDRVTQSGLCWQADGMCGTGPGLTQISYFGDPVIGTAFAYSILRAYLTPAERTYVSGILMNGLLKLENHHTPCENRIPSGPPTYNGYFTFTTPDDYGCAEWTATWFGSELPSSLVGKKFWHMRPWGKASFNSGDTSVTISTPGFTAELFSCERADGSYVPYTGSGDPDSAVVTLSQGFTAHTGADRLNAIHGFAGNEAILLKTTGVLPAPFQTNTVYYVKALSGNAFQVATTPGGPAVNITNSGSGSHSFYLPTAQGSCKAYTFLHETGGQVGTVRSVGAWVDGRQTFTFHGCATGRAPRQNVMWVLNPTNQNTCGYAWVSKWYANVPTFCENPWSSTTVAPLTSQQTSITVTSTAGLPTVFPHFLKLGGMTVLEVVKVTGISGNTLAVQRGQFNTEARPWGVSTTVLVNEAGGSDPDGWNNRGITRLAGHLTLAVALADDSAYAREVLDVASRYFQTNVFNATKFYNVLGSALNGYDISRLWHYYYPIVHTFMAATNNQVDYRQDWMKDFAGLRWIYMSAPWNTDFMINLGYTPNNCKSLNGTSEQSCFESAIQLLSLYPDSDEAKIAWKFSLDKGRITNAHDIAISARLIQALILNVKGTEQGLDWTLNQPTTRVFEKTADDDVDPSTNYNVLLSRSDWTANSSHLALFATDFFGEKFYDPYTGHYIIGKKGDYFVGQGTIYTPYSWVDTYNTNNYDMYQSTQSTTVVGNPISFLRVQPNTTTAGADMVMDSLVTEDTAYVRIDNKDAWNNTRMIFTVPRSFRHLVHFKPGETGTEQIVVYDELGLSGPGMIRDQIPYNMNGDSLLYQGITPYAEGSTTLNASGTEVTSVGSNGGGTKMFTSIVLGGTLYTSDLGLSWDYTTKTMTVGYDCTATAPCRVKAGENVFTYTAPSVIRFAGATDGAGDYFVWVDLTNGSLHVAHKTTDLVPSSCTGSIICEPSARADWPAGVGRLGHLIFSKGNLSGCPGAPSGTAGALDYHCGIKWQRRLVMSNGYNATSGEFLVVHHLKTGLALADPVQRLVSISPSFTGVEVLGSDPKVAVFGKGGTDALYNTVSFVTSHAGNGRYLVGGLKPGIYRVERNSVAIQPDVVVTADAKSLTFRSSSGAFVVSETGAVQALEILTAALPSVEVNQGYLQTLMASGGVPSYSWSVVEGELPPGLTVVPTGAISGVPTLQGTFSFTLQVRDVLNTTTTRTVSIQVTGGAAPITITNPELAEVYSGENVAIPMTVAGGRAPFQWSVPHGSLPAGITLDGATGLISGQTALLGDFEFRILVIDADSSSDSADVTLTVLRRIPESSIQFTVLSKQAILRFGDSELRPNVACTAEAQRLGIGATIGFSSVDVGGPMRRSVVLENLSPSSTYSVSIRCGHLAGSKNFSTSALGTPYTVTIPFQFSAPPNSNAQHLIVEYGSDPAALDQSVDLSCSGSCPGTLSLPGGQVTYVRAVWFDGAGQPVRQGPVMYVPVL